MPSLKSLLKAFAQSIGLPRSNASVILEAPTINDWSHVYIAPSNGTVYMYAADCAGVNLTNTSTTAMQTAIIRNAGGITLDSAFCIRAKKGDSITIYYAGSQTSSDVRCRFVPDTSA